MPAPYHGGCLCGAIRYRLTDEPLTLYACHCADCQRESGSSFGLSMILSRTALDLLQGEPQHYAITLPDGRQKHGAFCGACATRLWSEPVKFPQVVNVTPEPSMTQSGCGQSPTSGRAAHNPGSSSPLARLPSRVSRPTQWR
jgi:hypothetical protein